MGASDGDVSLIVKVSRAERERGDEREDFFRRRARSSRDPDDDLDHPKKAYCRITL